MSGYELVCVDNGEVVPERYTLECPSGRKTLLRARYNARQISPRGCRSVFRYSDWLPVRRTFETRTEPVVFKGDALSRELGLDNLWVGFTGYYPERGAYAVSGSFKELEALPTYARLADFSQDTVVIASAGNTARAFAEVGNQIGMRCVIVVPHGAANTMTVSSDRGFARLISVNGDYTDAISVADRIARFEGFIPEGGAKNIARRDGMGTVMVAGTLEMGRIPNHYFQAVGSGTGGIAAWEAALRLVGDGRYGTSLPRLELSQNEPFTPMAKAWNDGRREISEEDLGRGAADVAEVYADVLTNRKPPYSIAGGVYDAMKATRGRFRCVSNREARDAEKLWMSVESVRPNPAASVALASLIKAVEDGDVRRDARILLNMTGGGLERASEDIDLERVGCSANFNTDVSDDELKEILRCMRRR